MAEKKKKLFDQFPPISTAEWKAKVEADLKGAPFDKKLVWRTNEGFNVQPMYRLEDIEDLATTNSLPGEYPYLRGTRTDNNWLVRQEIIAETPAEANRIALDVLTKGVTSLGFKGAGPDSRDSGHTAQRHRHRQGRNQLQLLPEKSSASGRSPRGLREGERHCRDF